MRRRRVSSLSRRGALRRGHEVGDVDDRAFDRLVEHLDEDGDVRAVAANIHVRVEREIRLEQELSPTLPTSLTGSALTIRTREGNVRVTSCDNIRYAFPFWVDSSGFPAETAAFIVFRRQASDSRRAPRGGRGPIPGPRCVPSPESAILEGTMGVDR